MELENSPLLSKVEDKAILERNLKLLEKKRAFLSNSQRFGEYLRCNSDFREFVTSKNFVPVDKIIVVSAQELESSFGSLVYKYTLGISGSESTFPVSIYAKAHLPFTKGAPNYLFRESPEKRGQREACALSELESLQIEELVVPLLITYDGNLQLVITLGIDQIEEAVAVDPITDSRGVSSRLTALTLAKVHSQTYSDTESVSKEDARITSSILSFRGTAAQQIAIRDPSFGDLWLDFVRQTKSRQLCRIHGDLTPRNALVLHDSKLVLFDLDLSTLGDPAGDIGFFLGHYILEMVLRPENKNQIKGSTFNLWESYLENASTPLIGEVSDLEARVVNYIALTLFYRSWFRPAWHFQNPTSRNKIYDYAYSIFGKKHLKQVLDSEFVRPDLID